MTALTEVLEELYAAARSGGQTRVFLIINSRRQLPTPLDATPVIEVNALEVDDAKQLLLSLAPAPDGQHSWKWEDQLAQTIVEQLCGFNALAITLIAGFLKQGRCKSPQVGVKHVRCLLGK